MRRSTAAAAILLALLALSCLAEGRRSLKKSQAEKDAEALAQQQVRHCRDVGAGGAPSHSCAVQAARHLLTCNACGKGAGPGPQALHAHAGAMPICWDNSLPVFATPKHQASAPPLPASPPLAGPAGCTGSRPG